MDGLRRSARISKLDRKMNEYIGGKMGAQDMILDDVTRKQLIWYGHVEKIDPTRLPRIILQINGPQINLHCIQRFSFYVIACRH
jgi:hypothetical protein